MSSVTTKQEDQLEDKAVDEEEDRTGGPVFSPPLYLQRYLLVTDLLRQERVTSVVDFGCAECKLLRYLKNVESIEHIIGVDIDMELLQRHKSKLKPLTYEYLSRRANPLKMQLYQGSVTELDSRFIGLDACVLMEIIEHLELSDLDLVPDVVFGLMQPSLVIVTTPNSEYNVCFPDFTGYRHWDHKFEWTREHFQNWCSLVCRRFNYMVDYSGAGLPLEDKGDVGFCSQIAIFRNCQEIVKNNLHTKHKDPVFDVHCENSSQHSTTDNTHRHSSAECVTSSANGGPYSLVVEYVYPHKEKIPWADELKLEAEYYLRVLAKDADTWEEDAASVSLHQLSSFPKIQRLCPDQDKFRNFLSDLGYIFSEDKQSVLFEIEESDPFRNFSYDEHDEEDSDSINKEDNVSPSLSSWTPSCETEENAWDIEDSTSPHIVPTNSTAEASSSSVVVSGQFDDPEE